MIESNGIEYTDYKEFGLAQFDFFSWQMQTLNDGNYIIVFDRLNDSDVDCRVIFNKVRVDVKTSKIHFHSREPFNPDCMLNWGSYIYSCGIEGTNEFVINEAQVVKVDYPQTNEQACNHGLRFRVDSCGDDDAFIFRMIPVAS